MPATRKSLNDLARRVSRQLKRDTADIVSFASELIAIPSENPPGKTYDRCATYIARRLRELDLRVRTVNPSGDGPSVIGTFGEGGRALYFSGHYDVVPAQSESQFEPVVRKGSLHGRGAADMKGGIAAMAFAIRALATAGFEPAGRLVSVSVPDEETSGPRGTVALATAGIIERDAIGMLTMEPTGGEVWNANRGVISMRVTVHGRPAHVGLHFRGRNAFRGMLDVANALVMLDTEISARRTGFHIRPEAARRSVLLLGGELSGGHNFNVVPDRASFTIDRRTNPEEDFDRERDRLLAAIDLATQPGVGVDVEILQQGRSAATTARGALGRALGASLRNVTGRAPRFGLCPGVLETRHYAALGIPAMACGPGLLSVSHGPHEFVSVPRLVECARVYALTAIRLLS
ncbi:MAG: Succinyl-diaminopimelate desuccinylase [Gemmatimonadaceae bacterium]|nr:Succinyl-diaminopimelate desuccinylase [Gemmatimonadaceae bacterium]